jgi:hypothetical protein
MNKIKIYKYFLNELPDLLIKQYGLSKYYTWQQVYKTVENDSPRLLKHIIHAYALYCEINIFNDLENIIKGNNDYNKIREQYGVPKDNEFPFFNKLYTDIGYPDIGINTFAAGGDGGFH